MAAIADAKADGIARLSLAAAPIAGTGDWAARLVLQLSGGEGLGRFKELFAPGRTRLYVAAPSRAALAVAAFDPARAIRFPPPPPRQDFARRRRCNALS